jgi:alpha-L-rhamnosidase
MLDNGWTTFIEVFDPRWSHCHQWSACPTGQLTRYALGLSVRQDLGERTVVLDLRPGSLPGASGKVPLAGGEPIEVSWRRTDHGIDYRLSVHVPIQLRVGESGTPTTVSGQQRIVLPLPGATV